MACFSNCTRSFSSSDFNTYTWHLLSKALFTSKEGFSVGGSYQRHNPFFHGAQQCILLAFVETMDLVYE